MFPLIKDEVNFIMKLEIQKSLGIGGGGFLHLLLKSGRDPIPISRHKFCSTLKE